MSKSNTGPAGSAKPKLKAGGRATSGGVRFQVDVAAWVAAHLLAERPVVFDELTLASADWISMETEDDVDDVQFSIQDSGVAYVQAKRTLDAVATAKSEFAKTARQFVRQFRAGVTLPGAAPRPFEPGVDWLLIAVGADTRAPIAQHLRSALRRRGGGATKLTQDEGHYLAIWRGVLEDAWRSEAKGEPPQASIDQILDASRVWLVDKNVVAERAPELIAQISDTDRAEAIWRTLEIISLGLAEAGARTTHADLRRRLEAQARLKARPSLQHDVQQLRERSGKVRARLRRFVQINAPDGLVETVRESLDPVLEGVGEGSLLLIGAPGAGKSGLLTHAADVLEGVGEVVVLQVEAVADTFALQNVLGLGRPLAEVLAHWPGSGPAYLLIDALDAARGGPADAVFRQVIEDVLELGHRWRVVASVRSFDLRMGHELRRLFRGTPPRPDLSEAEFASVRHLSAPGWSDTDLDNVFAQSDQLRLAVGQGGPRLARLVRNPFNMSLLGELLQASPQSAQAAATRADLLRAYWQLRVTSVGVAGTHALSGTVEAMIAADALEVHVLDTGANNGGAIQVLAQSGVLELDENDQVQFSHHVLFDYAVARLHLGRTPDPSALLARGQANGPKLAPALQFWIAEQAARRPPADVWTRVTGLIGAKTIDALARAELAKWGADLVASGFGLPELIALGASDPDGPAAEALLDMAATMAAQETLSPAAASNWAQVADGLPLQGRNLVTVQWLVREITKVGLTGPGAQAWGKAARKLLGLTLQDDAVADRFLRSTIGPVVAAFDTDLPASLVLIRALIEPARVQRRGYAELGWIAHEARRLAQLDPRLSQELWRAVFAAETADPKKVTPMNGGYIVPLTSTAGQDLEMARFSLRDAFPTILEGNVRTALHCLLGAIEGWTSLRSAALRSSSCGRSGRLQPDGSTFWSVNLDSGHSDVGEILKSFETQILTLSLHRAQRLIALALGRSPSCLLISRLMKTAAQAPAGLGRSLLSVAEAGPVLETRETREAAILLIKSVRAVLSPQEDQALLARLAEAPIDPDLRAKIISVIAPAPPLTSPTGRTRVLRPGRTNEQIALEAFQRRLPNPQHEWIRHSGGDIDSPLSREVLRASDTLRARREQMAHNNTPARAASVQSALSQLEAHITASTGKLDPMVERTASAELAIAAGALLTRACGAPSGVAPLKALLIGLLSHPWPPLLADSESTYRGSGDYASPAPRIAALEALLGAVDVAGVWDTALEAELSSQILPGRHPGIRGHIASRLELLAQADPAAMWRLIDQSIATETNAMVRADLFSALSRLLHNDGRALDKALKLVPELNLEDEGVAQEVAGILVLHGIGKGHAASLVQIDAILSAPMAKHVIATDLVQGVRNMLVAMTASGADLQVRARALSVLDRALDGAIPVFDRAVKQDQTLSEEEAKVGVVMIDQVCSQLYFGSGAFRAEQREGPDLLPTPADKAAFLAQITPITKRLAHTGTPKTTHHLMQLLAHLAPGAPGPVFDLAAEIILRRDAIAPYQREDLAAELVVKLFGYLVSDHRALFKDPPRRDQLVDSLDSFVQFGWLPARRFMLELPELI